MHLTREILIAAALALAAMAQPPDVRVSLRALTSEALKNNPEIVAAQKSYEAARQRLALERVEIDDQDIERINQLAGSTDFLAHLSQRLPPEQFHALCARFVEERRYVDIAQQLRCSPVVVRMRVSSALTTLRNTRSEDGDD